MQFNLQVNLDKQAQHQPAFTPELSTGDDFILWQAELRTALTNTLGIGKRISQDSPSTELISSEDKGIYIEEKHYFHMNGVVVPMYILIPKTPPPYRTILAFHGHGIGVQQILGNYANADVQATMIANDENFAQQFVEAGYLVCAIEQQGFGERITDQVNEHGNSCRHLAFQYQMLGKTLIGERVLEGIVALNYLLSRDDVTASSIACVGHSGGAMTTLFLSTLDERVKQIIISGYFCDYRHSILAMPHCECNYVPDLLTLADVGTLAMLIAPRHLLFINGQNDTIFPIAGFHQPYQSLQEVYDFLNETEKLSAHHHDYGHRFDADIARDWLRQHN